MQSKRWSPLDVVLHHNNFHPITDYYYADYYNRFNMTSRRKQARPSRMQENEVVCDVSVVTCGVHRPTIGSNGEMAPTTMDNDGGGEEGREKVDFGGKILDESGMLLFIVFFLNMVWFKYSCLFIVSSLTILYIV